MPQENRMRSESGKTGQISDGRREITPELVRQVAERVYAMLRDELLIERERARTASAARKGGFRA